MRAIYSKGKIYRFLNGLVDKEPKWARIGIFTSRVLRNIASFWIERWDREHSQFIVEIKHYAFSPRRIGERDYFQGRERAYKLFVRVVQDDTE